MVIVFSSCYDADEVLIAALVTMVSSCFCFYLYSSLSENQFLVASLFASLRNLKHMS